MTHNKVYSRVWESPSNVSVPNLETGFHGRPPTVPIDGYSPVWAGTADRRVRGPDRARRSGRKSLLQGYEWRINQ
jgi:hypothetical protein